MAKILRIGGDLVASVGILLVLVSLYGFTAQEQAHLRGLAFGIAATQTEQSGDAAAAKVASFHDDDIAMGAGWRHTLASSAGQC